VTRKSDHGNAYNVLAVAIWGTLALVSSDLHEALLAGTTHCGWIAATFLHRE
jgi:hypothetical protein